MRDMSDARVAASVEVALTDNPAAASNRPPGTLIHREPSVADMRERLRRELI